MDTRESNVGRAITNIVQQIPLKRTGAYKHQLSFISRWFPTKKREKYRWSLISNMSFEGDDEEETQLAIAAGKYEFFTKKPEERAWLSEFRKRSIERDKDPRWSAANRALLSFMQQNESAFPQTYGPQLFAHGTDNCRSLCEILVDGALKPKFDS